MTSTEALEEMLSTLFDRGMYGGMEPDDILAALPDDTAIVTVDSLAAALHDRSMRCNQNRHYCADPDSPGSGHLRDARKLIKAAKEASDE